MDYSILITDTETSRSGKGAGVVEIGWMEIDRNLNILSTFDSLVYPGHRIEARTTEVHGITDRDVQYAPSLDMVISSAAPRYNWFTKVFFVAHNAHFDLKFLRNYWDIEGTMCTVMMARKIFPKAPDHKLQTLKKYLDLDSGISHRAMGDVTTTYSLLKKMAEETGKDFPGLCEMITNKRK